jgi:hypothetical protein
VSDRIDPEHGPLYFLPSPKGGRSDEPTPGMWEVDPNTGELFPRCADCILKDDELAGLKTNLKGWQLKYAQLARDAEAAARDSRWWPVAVTLFGIWKELARHPRSVWTLDRFQLAEPYLEKYGPELCERAIAGICFDPFITRRKNGTRHVHNDWHLIFRDADTFEERCNAAPTDWKATRRWDELGPLQRVPALVETEATG